MNCNLSDLAGPGIKEEVTSHSWENREKFAASREKCFLTEDTPQEHVLPPGKTGRSLLLLGFFDCVGV